VLSDRSALTCISDDDSPLSQVCKHDPPSDVITAMLQENKEAALRKNCEGRYPLHVACMYGASPEVIKLLVKVNEDAAIKKDKYGMLPIHLACRFYVGKSQRKSSRKSQEKRLVLILGRFIRMKPDIVLEEDGYGKCPIEQALESELSMYIIDALRNQAEITLRKRYKCESKYDRLLTT